MEVGNVPASLEHRIFCLAVAILMVSALLLLTASYTVNMASGSFPFSSDRMVSDPDESSDQYYPDVAVSPNGTIYVVWEDSRHDPTPGSPPYVVDIFISYSSNRGAGFSENAQITDHSQTTVKSEPSIAVDPAGTVYVAWWDNTGLYIQKSTDGISFSGPVEVSTGVNGTFKIAPSVCAPAPGRVHVAYSAPTGPEGRIFLATSGDGGASFSSVRVDDATPSYRTNPDIAVSQGGDIYVVWQDERNGDSDIYFTKSTDGGLTFSPDERVNDDIGTANQDTPSIAVAKSGNIYIAWTDTRNANSDIFFSKSTDGGNTFGDGILNNNDVEVDDFPGAAMHDYPVVAVDDFETIYVTWRDTRNGFSDKDIYFSQSEDGGVTFGDGLKNDNDVKVNDDLEGTDQQIPAMALTPDGSICIVWYDNRNFAQKRVDIYFSIFLGAAPDLVIAGGSVTDITFHPPSPQVEGTAITINATVYNLGNENASNVVVRFYDNSIDPLNQIGGDEVVPFIPSFGGNTTVSMEWICQEAGIHTIVVSVDPEDEIIEWDESNNVASQSFSVLPLQNPASPENVSASLFGLANTGVIVTWTLSLDDKGGRNTVERYDVYRSTDYDSSGLGYQLIGSISKGLNNYMDLGTGYGDPSDYFYMVCAYNSTLGSSCSLTQGAKTNIHVVKGWNLLAFPLIMWKADVGSVLRTIDFDVVRKYDVPSSTWKSYFSWKHYGDLGLVDVSSGFWIHCPEDGNLSIAGQVPRDVQLVLHAGWNLVALPSFSSDVSLSDLLAAFPLRGAEIFDPLNPPHFLREMSTLEVFNPKRGYWLEALEDITIPIPN
ncbi:MAG: CARDB domain-containing protein [Thermoplasmata archaeon]